MINYSGLLLHERINFIEDRGIGHSEDALETLAWVGLVLNCIMGLFWGTNFMLNSELCHEIQPN